MRSFRNPLRPGGTCAAYDSSTTYLASSSKDNIRLQTSFHVDLQAFLRAPTDMSKTSGFIYPLNGASLYIYFYGTLVFTHKGFPCRGTAQRCLYDTRSFVPLSFVCILMILIFDEMSHTN